jgi:autotransporter-associated beta strand protein
MQNRKQTMMVWFSQQMTALWFAMAIVFIVVPAAQAQVTAAWNQDADGNWSTGSNWIAGNAPTGTTGIAYFTNAITASRTVTVDASPWTIGGLTFGNTGAYGFTVSGGTVNLGGTTPTITVNPGSTGSVSSVLSGTSGLTKVGAGTLTLGGVNTYSGGTTISAGTLSIASSGALNGTTLVNPISGGTLSISGTVTITNGVFAAGCGTAGTGTMNIESGAVVNVANGANASRAYVGGKLDNTGTAGLGVLNLNGGILSISAGGTGAAGDASCFWLNPYGSGGASTLNLNGGVLSTARPIADGGTGASILNFNGGTLKLAASISLIGNPTLGANNVRNGGAIIDTQGYTVTQAHAMIHSPIGGDSAIDGGLTKLGTGVLTLLGANTYTGPTTVSNGLLIVTTTGALPGYATAGKVTVSNGAGLSVGVGSWSSAAITALINTGAYGSGSIFGFDTTAGNYTYSGQFTLPAIAGLVKTGPNALTFPGGTGFAGSVNVLGGILQAEFGAGIPATTNIVLNNGSLSSISGSIIAALGTGAEQITLTPNTSVGFSAVNTPLTVNLGGAGAPLSWGSPTFNPSSFVLNDAGANTNLLLQNALALNATRTINVNASVAEISGVISNGSATAGLIKGGAGTLKLSAANTFTGDITLNAGTLDLGGNTHAMTTGNFTMANATTLQNGTINYKNASWGPNGNASVTFGAGGGFNCPNRLLLQTHTLTLAAGAGATSFGGDAANNCNYIGVDQAAANTVNVNGGSLNFTNMASGSGYLRIGINGNATTKPTGTLTVNNGAVNVGHSMSMGTRFDMGAGVAYGVATLSINGGQMAIGTGAATAYATGTYGWLYLGNNNASTVSKATINLNGGTLSLIQLEAGSYGTNTVTFNGGTLKARANTSTLINGTNVTITVGASGAIVDTDAYQVGFGENMARLTGTGILTKRGAGELVLNGSNTYNGAISVEQGKLTLSPLGTPNLKMHLDASRPETLFTNATGVVAVTGSGQPVGYWGDRSGHGKAATNATAAARPTYVTGVAAFNNLPVLQFDGSDDELTSALDINPGSLPNLTVMMVFRQVTYKMNGGLWGHDNGSWDRLQLLNFGTIGLNNIAGSGNSITVNGMNTNTVLLYTAVLRNGAANSSYVYINGQSDTTNGLPTFTSTDNGGQASFTLANIAQSGGYCGNIQIGEVMVFDAALNDLTRRNAEAYLRNKWLGASDPITSVCQSDVTVAAGATLNLGGIPQTLASVSGSGIISNGSLSVTGSISPAGAGLGTLRVADASLNGTLRIDVTTDGVSDCLAGLGNLNLSGLTLQIADTGLLDKHKSYTLVTCSGTLTGELTASLPKDWRLRYDRTAGTATLVYISSGTMVRFM